MSALWGTPLAFFAPQLALGAGLFAALAAGLGRPSRAPRALGLAALSAALVLSASAFPGGAGALVRLDGLTVAWQVLFCAGALPLLAAPSGGGDDEVEVALLLGSVLGMGLLAASWNLLLLFIGLEFMSLPAYLLVARGARRQALEGAIKYFFAGALAGALFLLGLALYYASARSLALVGAPGPLAEAGLALMGAAALFKVGAVPLHFWLPDVYESSEPELAAFLSTAMKAAGLLLLMRLTALLPFSSFARALPAVGALTALAGALLALRQQGLQRLLAYSSVSHAGLMILGVGAWAAQGAVPASAAALAFYLLAYLFMSTGAFWLVKASGASTRAELRGLARRDPWLAAAGAALLLALAGIPPAAGFLAKLLIFWEGVKAGLYWETLAAGLAALVSLGYYAALLRDIWLEEPAGPVPAPGRGRAVAAACAVPAAVLGLAPWLLEPLGRLLGR